MTEYILNIDHIFNKKRNIFFAFILSLLSIVYTPGYTQDITVTAKLDTNSIIIGQQAHIILNVEYNTNQGDLKITFPAINDTIIKQLEVVSKSKIEKFLPDSSDLNRMAQKQIITITSFDSGYYAIPPFKFSINNNTEKVYETEALLFSVITVNVDTTKSIMDIKPPLEVPFSWKEYLPYVYQSLALLAVLGALIYLIITYLKNKKKKPIPKIEIPKTPVHVITLERLERLKEAKLWQQGKLKQYHSELSDIMRHYIEQRFYINAMEQVTDEIMHSFRKVDISEEIKMKLRGILFLSDLVKFAKEQPLPNENELSWTNAVDFVNTTKKEEQPQPSSEATTDIQSDKQIS